MRYPFGSRDSLSAACDAAREASRTSGLRYRVYISRYWIDCVRAYEDPATQAARLFVFTPTVPLGPQHEAVRL